MAKPHPPGCRGQVAAAGGAGRGHGSVRCTIPSSSAKINGAESSSQPDGGPGNALNVAERRNSTILHRLLQETGKRKRSFKQVRRVPTQDHDTGGNLRPHAWLLPHVMQARGGAEAHEGRG